MTTKARGLSLHIGLNAVDPGHYGGWSGELGACEADADDMLVIAKNAGCDASVLLKTREATRNRALSEIQKAAGALRSGDLFFLTYSGHGGQVPDKNGDESDFEDETWCLYDGQVIDDELNHLWLKFAAGVRILVLSDSCHSGSVTRAVRADLTRGVPTRAGPGEGAPRYRAMPDDAATRTYQQNKAFYDELQARQPADKGRIVATVRLISGCQDNQLSSDGTFNGLFTSTLLRVWHGGGFKGDYARFHKEIVRRMPSEQTPNHFVIGAANPQYDAQKPFTI